MPQARAAPTRLAVLCRIGGAGSPAGAIRDGDPTSPALFAEDASPSVRRRGRFYELFDPSGDPVPPVSPRQGVFPERCDEAYEIDPADRVVLSLWPVLDRYCKPDYFLVVGGAAAARIGGL